MNGKLILTILAGVLLALPASQLAWGKAHVPLNRAQICTSDGKVKNIKLRKLAKKLKRGACRLPGCDFNFVKMPGDYCDPTDDVGNPHPGNPLAGPDGFCDDPGSPATVGNALGVTPACINPY